MPSLGRRVPVCGRAGAGNTRIARTHTEGRRMIDLHEIFDVKPGAMGEFLDGVERESLPAAQRHGVALVACWETVFSQGEPPEAIALWELRDWAHLGRLNEAQHPAGEGD